MTCVPSEPPRGSSPPVYITANRNACITEKSRNLPSAWQIIRGKRCSALRNRYQRTAYSFRHMMTCGGNIGLLPPRFHRLKPRHPRRTAPRRYAIAFMPHGGGSSLSSYVENIGNEKLKKVGIRTRKHGILVASLIMAPGYFRDGGRRAFAIPIDAAAAQALDACRCRIRRPRLHAFRATR